MRANCLPGLALAAVASLSGCIPSNVLVPSERSVNTEKLSEPDWRPASSQDLFGFYESDEVMGDSAGALLKAYYYFVEDGSYSGAALVLGEEGPRFLVVTEDGRWSLDSEGLDLGDGSGKLQALVAGELLRLVSPGSAVTFHRVELR